MERGRSKRRRAARLTAAEARSFAYRTGIFRTPELQISRRTGTTRICALRAGTEIIRRLYIWQSGHAHIHRAGLSEASSLHGERLAAFVEWRPAHFGRGAQS